MHNSLAKQTINVVAVFAVAATSALAGACGSEKGEYAPVEVRTLTPVLPDRSSATGAVPPLLWAGSNVEYTNPKILTPAALSAIKNQVTVVTWPELEPVAAAVEVTETQLYVAVEPVLALRVVPAQPLQPRWYAVRAALQHGWAAQADLYVADWFAAGPGVSLARFYPGHQPVLRRLMYGAKGGKGAVTLVASEEVTGAAVPLTVRQNGQALACENNASHGTVLSVLCPVWNDAEPFEISLTQDALSSDGQPMRLLSGETAGPWLAGAGQKHQEMLGLTYVVP